MAKYKFYIADKLTKIPLVGGEIAAVTKFHAKRKIYKEILNKDKGYIITLRKVKGGKEDKI